jgi:Tol biopolymer transport system component
VFSPDGSQVAFSSDPDGVTLMSLKDGDTTVVPNQPPQDRFLSGDLAWAPDGRRLAFVNDETIFTISLDGSDLREVTQGSLPSWTQDGEHIVFVSGWDGSTGGEGDIMVVRGDGTGPRFLVRGLYPDVSPSADEVAYSTPTGVFVLPLAGGTPQLVVPNGFGPVWSPDGEFLAFTRYTTCGHAACSGRVFVAPVEGGEPRPIGPTTGDPGGPEDWTN